MIRYACGAPETLAFLFLLMPLQLAVVVEAALPFHILNFPAGHAATNFSHWFKVRHGRAPRSQLSGPC